MGPVNTKVKFATVGAIAAIATGVGIAQATADPTPAPSTGSSGASSGAGGSSSGAASANSGTTDSGTSGTTDRGWGGRHGHGPGMGPGGMGFGGMGPGGMGFGMDSGALADKLGVDQAKLTAALQKVWTSLRDGDDSDDRTGPPTDAERQARQQEFATALAKELGIDAAKVTAAFDELRAERQAEARAAFGARLDEAVKAGKLTEADKASVLKAFDAGVLGGPWHH